MQSAEFLRRRGDGGLPAWLLDDVERDEMRGGAQFPGKLAALRLVAVGQHGLAALAYDHAGSSGADARRAAAQQHDFAVKTGQGATSSSGPM